MSSHDDQVEAELKSCAYVDNICLYANSQQNFVVGLVTPNEDAMRQLCTHLGIEGEMSYRDMCNDPEIQSEVVKAISEHGLKSGLTKIEIPKKLKLCCEEWSPESGFVTSTLAVRREKITQFYKKDINRMYGVLDYNRNLSDPLDGDNNNSRSGLRQETQVTIETRDTNHVEIEMHVGNETIDEEDQEDVWREAIQDLKTETSQM